MFTILSTNKLQDEIRELAINLSKKFGIFRGIFLVAVFIITSVVILALTPPAQAATTYYAIADADWNVNTTWSLTSKGDDAPVGVWPVAGDTVYIGESNQSRAVTIPSGYSAAAASIILGDNIQNKFNSLTLADSTASLAVSGNIDINRPGGANTNALNVNAGTVSVGGTVTLAGADTTADRISKIVITTGNLTISGDLVFVTGNAASNVLTMSGGAGTLNLAGAFTVTDGTLTPGTTSTFNFNGASAQTIPIGVSSIVYNNLNVNNSDASGATVSAAVTDVNVTGNIRVQTGLFNNGGFAIGMAESKIFEVANGATFTMTGTTGMVTGTALTKTFGATSTTNYAGTAQTVSAETYGNLTFSGSDDKTTASGTTTVAGNWNITGATALLSTNNSSVTVTGDITGTGAITSGSGTISLAGDCTNNGVFTADTGAVTYTATAGGQTICGFTYNNLTLSNTSGTNTAGGNMAVSGALATTAGGTLAMTAAYTLGGTLSTITNNGTISTSVPTATSATPIASGKTWGGTIVYAATAGAQTLVAGTYNNLTINGTGGVTATNDLSVNGILNLQSANPSATNGSVDMGSGSSLTMGDSATTVGAGDATGIVKRTTLVAGTSYTFGNQYTTINFLNTGTLPTEISFKTTIGAAPTWKTGAIKRYYDIVQSGSSGSGSFATLNLHYLDSELNGNTENNLVKWFTQTPATPGSAVEYGRSNYDETENWVGTAAFNVSLWPTGFDQSIGTLGDSALSSATWNGSVSTSWSTPGNWTPNSLPSDLVDIIIPDASTTPNDPSLNLTLAVGRLTIESGGILNSADASEVTISGGSGAWSNNGGTFNPSTGSVIFTNAGASISGITNFYNVTIDSGATVSVGSDATMRIAGAMTNNGTWDVAQLADTTVEYNGGGQTVLNPNGPTPGYYNLTLSGSGTKTMPATALSISGNFSLSGTASATALAAINTGNSLTIGSGASFTAGALTHTVGKDFSNSGTFTAAGSAMTLNGASAQVIGGTASTTFNNLLINNSAGVTLDNASPMISGALTFTSGTITTGASVLYINSTGSVSRTSGHVAGNLKKYLATGATSKTFEIGDASNYTPVSISFGNVTVAGDAIVSTTSGDHPNLSTSTLYSIGSVNRYWTATNVGISFDMYSAIFNFINPGDLDAGADSADFIMGIWSGSSWSYPTIGAITSASIEATGLTSFSDFQLAEASVAPNAPTLVSPSSGSTITNNTPTLSANYSDSNTGDTGTTNYRISSSSLSDCTNNISIIASGTSAATASNNADTTWTPTSSIGGDATYYWCAQNNDDELQSAWVSMGSFVVNTATTPAAGGAVPALWHSPPKAPTEGFGISINNGAETTTIPTVALNLKGGSDTAKIAISNFSDFRDAVQEDYAVTKTWNLCWHNSVLKTPVTCPDEVYTVYVKYYSPWGAASNVVSDTIIFKTLDQTDQNPKINLGLERIKKEAAILAEGDVSQLIAETGVTIDSDSEDRYRGIILKVVEDTEVSSQIIKTITTFIAYGTLSTKSLGAGERAGVVNSLKSAFGRLPTTPEDWNDVIKIANGRWPGQTSQTAEDQATDSFKKVYLRSPDRTNPHDDAAVMVMAYGLRPANRNLDSEKTAIIIFKAIYGYTPSVARAWDVVRAIAYSGATR